MMNKSKALRVERQPRKFGGPRLVYVFRCVYNKCAEEVKIRSANVSESSGLCLSHAHVKRPFESLYMGLFNDWRKPTITLTYEEFLEFTKTKECHYCGLPIDWRPFSTVKGIFGSRARYLDKKVPTGPYSKENCVVCCTRCNIARRDLFTYEQFLEIGSLIRKWRE